MRRSEKIILSWQNDDLQKGFNRINSTETIEFENVFNKHNSLKGGEIYRNDHLKLEK